MKVINNLKQKELLLMTTKNIKKITLTSFLILFIFTTFYPISSQEKKRQKGQQAKQTQKFLKLFFETNDSNKDGKVSKEEWTSQFDAMDKNKDGSIDKQELRQYLRKKQEERRQKRQNNQKQKNRKNKLKDKKEGKEKEGPAKDSNSPNASEAEEEDDES